MRWSIRRLLIGPIVPSYRMRDCSVALAGESGLADGSTSAI
jgi:hypothetical protein